VSSEAKPEAAPWRQEYSLRSWLRLLSERGELGRLTEKVDPSGDVAAVLEACDGRRSVRFDAVTGADYPLVGNTVHGRNHLALAMGCGVDELAARYAAAVAAPVEPVQVARAPVLAARLDGRMLDGLPLTVQHAQDAGRYLTSALVAVTDPRSGATNLSINRMAAAGSDRLKVLILPGRLARILTEAEGRGWDLELAVLIGVDPTLLLASQAPARADLDDLGVAGALRGAAVPVATAPGTRVRVPAEAEFCLTGRIRAGHRETEGPFGEFPGTYGPAAPAPVIELEAGWHRGGPVCQTILSGGREHLLVGGLPREARMLAALRSAGFDLAAVRLPESGSCRLHAVVALRNPAPGAAVNAMFAAFAANPIVKHVLVVDDDVDIFAEETLGWVLATRVQADKDVHIVSGARGSSLDPSAEDARTAKMGIDATVSPAKREHHARMRVAAHDEAAVRRWLAVLGMPVNES
jgi:2,5-furandicarboxylate decarboxylase 1